MALENFRRVVERFKRNSGIKGREPILADALVDQDGDIVAKGFNGSLTNGTGGSIGGGGSGDVATDTIWNAAGDLAVGTGADTAARLAKGSALDVLRVKADGSGLEWAANSAAAPAIGNTITIDAVNGTSGGTVGGAPVQTFAQAKTLWDALTTENKAITAIVFRSGLHTGQITVEGTMQIDCQGGVTWHYTGTGSTIVTGSTPGRVWIRGRPDVLKTGNALTQSCVEIGSSNDWHFDAYLGRVNCAVGNVTLDAQGRYSGQNITFANSTARGAYTGMSTGDVGFQQDTGVRYIYVSGSWQVLNARTVRRTGTASGTSWCMIDAHNIVGANCDNVWNDVGNGFYKTDLLSSNGAGTSHFYWSAGNSVHVDANEATSVGDNVFGMRVHATTGSLWFNAKRHIAIDSVGEPAVVIYGTGTSSGGTLGLGVLYYRTLNTFGLQRIAGISYGFRNSDVMLPQLADNQQTAASGSVPFIVFNDIGLLWLERVARIGSGESDGAILHLAGGAGSFFLQGCLLGPGQANTVASIIHDAGELRIMGGCYIAAKDIAAIQVNGGDLRIIDSLVEIQSGDAAAVEAAVDFTVMNATFMRPAGGSTSMVTGSTAITMTGRYSSTDEITDSNVTVTAFPFGN